VLDGVLISGAQIIGEGVMATMGEGVVQTFLSSGVQIFCFTPVFQSSPPILPMFAVLSFGFMSMMLTCFWNFDAWMLECQTYK